ncbi:proline--tRNA ligase [Actinocatenispora thailandica]|nr:proline--tRNA ligase [Actinocatenispora thailandica]
MSGLFGATLHTAPGSSESAGHQQLLRAGMVRQLAQGIFSYLPLGWRSIRKIEHILREEMAAVAGQELSMPVAQPDELWRTSGRYHKVGAELARFADRRGRGMVLAMTHEEAVTELARSEIDSYRDLPRMVFQLQTKFRDDPRPRAGLIRVREFVMKDAYSLDRDAAGLARQYANQYRAYFRVFGRCGVPVLAVASDVGMMGGELAHEFMYPTPIGEDTLLLCDSCGYRANRQVATFAKPTPPDEAARPMRRFATPQAASVAQLAAAAGVRPDRIAKAVFVQADLGEAEAPVIAVVRGDMDLNESKLAAALGAAGLRPMTADEIAAIGAVAGYGSPVGVTAARVVVDDLVAATPNLLAGANLDGYHLRDVNVGRDFTPELVCDIVAARAGDGCPDCGAALRTTRGVEVGNIFKLGDRYSAVFGATFTDADGARRPVQMGCYGIGVGRLLGCAAQAHHDDRGLTLPITIAPYQVHLCQLGGAGSEAAAAAQALYERLGAAGVEVLHDDRGQRAGSQFADADLIGLPLRATVGARSLARGEIELHDRRTGESWPVPVGAAAETVTAAVSDRLSRANAVPPVSLPPELADRPVTARTGGAAAGSAAAR